MTSKGKSGPGAPRCAQDGGSRRQRRSCSTRVLSSPIRGSICSSRPAPDSSATYPTPTCSWWEARAEQVAREQERAAAAGAHLVFAGQRRRERDSALRRCLRRARFAAPGGTNTPLKIYSYLRSNRPIVATRLVTHTQVLDDTCACLVEPTADALAAGLRRMIEHPEARRAVGRRGSALAASGTAAKPMSSARVMRMRA